MWACMTHDWQPGIGDPTVKDYIARHQIDAAGWFVANPQVSNVDIRRFQRMDAAVQTFLDTMADNTEIDATTRSALRELQDEISMPKGVDY